MAMLRVLLPAGYIESQSVNYFICHSFFHLVDLRPIYMAENFWYGSDKKGSRTKKLALLPCLHVLFSTVLSGSN